MVHNGPHGPQGSWSSSLGKRPKQAYSLSELLLQDCKGPGRYSCL